MGFSLIEFSPKLARQASNAAAAKNAVKEILDLGQTAARQSRTFEFAGPGDSVIRIDDFSNRIISYQEMFEPAFGLERYSRSDNTRYAFKNRRPLLVM